MEKPILLGITGNIASGKSAVRQFLENEGVLTIDADLLAQETYLPGRPAHQAVIEAFGEEICYADGQINRSRLGRIVFNDPVALTLLEGIIHPQVTVEIDSILSRAAVPLVAVEAIKLFESKLVYTCDQIWTVTAADALRKERLMSTRGLSSADADLRINSQSPQEEKAARSDLVISTDDSWVESYAQTMAGLKQLLPGYAHSVQTSAGSDYMPLRPETFPAAREALKHYDIDAEYDDEALFQTISQRSIMLSFSDQSASSFFSWKITQFLGLVSRLYPYSPTDEAIAEPLEALESLAKRHLCQLLCVPQALLSAHNAKILAYSPGEYYPAGVNPIALSNFLRKHGLMPGEVYLKAGFDEINS